MSRKSCSDAGGFTLIEALVALAIVAAVLGSIGAVIATTVTLLAALPARTLLKPGRQIGETAGHRWRIDVSPMNVAVSTDAPTQRFVPLAVSLRLQAPGGPAMQVTTVRLVPKVAE